MDNPPAFDRSLLIPVLLGGFSVTGIVVVLIIGRSLSTPPEAPVTPSHTPFQFQYLGTEPAISTPLIEETPVEITEPPFVEPGVPATGAVTEDSPGLATPIILASPTLDPLRTNTPAPASPTSASLAPLNPGAYDDVDSRLVYNGWNATTVAGAFGNTLHVSLVPGSSISFQFIGRQVRLLYQGGSTLGRLSVTIDGSTTIVDQSDENEWASETLSNGTHTVLITHLDGGSVNLDRVIIPDPATPTPTRTPLQS